MDDNCRYSGPPTVRWSYMNEFAVECPICKGEALVTLDQPNAQKNGKLTCRNCMHSEKALDLVRYKMIVKRNCDNCGKAFEAEISNQKEKNDQITLPCPHCGTTRDYQPRHDEYILNYENEGKASDPIFNLPLWFQVEIRGNLFWAYNRAHLSEIKAYVKAKLRERRTTTHTTMVERLPNFVKDSKNRASLIKAIEKLERKTRT